MVEASGLFSIVMDSRAAYTGTEPSIWPTSERLAKAWKTFMETGNSVEP